MVGLIFSEKTEIDWLGVLGLSFGLRCFRDMFWTLSLKNEGLGFYLTKDRTRKF